MPRLLNYGMCVQTILKLQQVSEIHGKYGTRFQCYRIQHILNLIYHFIRNLAPERDFLPNMEDYFAEATEQLDPANQVEDEYK